MNFDHTTDDVCKGVVFEPSVRLFDRTDIVTIVFHEQLEQSR